MDRISYERFVQRIKTAVTRDSQVNGVIQVGPGSIQGDRDRAPIFTFYLITRDDALERYRTTTDWLPDADAVSEVVPGDAGLRTIGYRDGRRIELHVVSVEEFADRYFSEYRVLLDRAGIGRLAKSITKKPRPRYAGPPAADAPREAAPPEPDDGGASSKSDIAVRPDPETEARRAIFDPIAGTFSIPRVTPEPDDGPVFEAMRPTVAPEPAQDSAGPSPDLHPPADAGGPSPNLHPPAPSDLQAVGPGSQRPMILSPDACPFCGGELGPAGRLYQKGGLNDVRFLGEDAPRLAMKKLVLVRPCLDCGFIAMRLEET